MSRTNRQRAAETPAEPTGPEQKPDAGEQTADYTRCGGHVLTDMGWMPEDLVEKNRATRSTVTDGSRGDG